MITGNRKRCESKKANIPSGIIKKFFAPRICAGTHDTDISSSFKLYSEFERDARSSLLAIAGE